MGELIKKDGTFVLPHIGPGAHDVTILMPRDGGSLGDSMVLKNVDLANHGPLILHIDAPSPGSMAMIFGHFRFTGGRPKQPITIWAHSPQGISASSTLPHLERGDHFSLGPVPSGQYRVTFESPEIETKEVVIVAAPFKDVAKDVAVDIHIHGAIVLRGSVSIHSEKGHEPAREFLLRVVRVKYRTGPQPSERWERIFIPSGNSPKSCPAPGFMPSKRPLKVF